MPRHIDMIVCPHGETGPKNTRNSEGAIIELNDGRFLMAYTHFYEGGSDFGAGDIRGKRSEDGGATWSEPFMIEPNTAVCNVGRLAMFRLRPVARVAPHVNDLEEWRTDILGHVCVEVNNYYHNRMLVKRSGDEGDNWSTPVQINDTGTLGWICQLGDSVAVLSTGRILVPSYAVFGGLNCSFMYCSDDGGDTWRRSVGEIGIPIKGPTGGRSPGVISRNRRW